MSVIDRRGNTLEQKAYDYLRKSIIAHDYPAGMRIIESDIADKLGISRTPVRAALRHLERERLVYFVQNVGTFVGQTTIKDVNEITEFITVLEIQALESCVKKASDEEIDRCINEVSSMSSQDTFEETRKKDEYFDDFIISYCENSRILYTLKDLMAEYEHPRYSMDFNPKRIQYMRHDHLQILHHIKERSFSKAARALAKHNNKYFGFMDDFLKQLVL